MSTFHSGGLSKSLADREARRTERRLYNLLSHRAEHGIDPSAIAEAGVPLEGEFFETVHEAGSALHQIYKGGDRQAAWERAHALAKSLAKVYGSQLESSKLDPLALADTVRAR
jgi:hypothetical protein